MILESALPDGAGMMIPSPPATVALLIMLRTLARLYLNSWAGLERKARRIVKRETFETPGNVTRATLAKQQVITMSVRATLSLETVCDDGLKLQLRARIMVLDLARCGIGCEGAARCFANASVRMVELGSHGLAGHKGPEILLPARRGTPRPNFVPGNVAPQSVTRKPSAPRARSRNSGLRRPLTRAAKPPFARRHRPGCWRRRPRRRRARHRR